MYACLYPSKNQENLIKYSNYNVITDKMKLSDLFKKGE